ncbi:MAG: metallophosphoesterase family protein [Prevotella sp.]|jgi:hypothetical protein|nr:metallophosphoesterase family protein [Prevotella sp.]
MKKTAVILILITLTISASAQRKKLNFNQDGNFKIVQFTDIHYKQGVPESKVAIDLINEILDVEKPDLVVFTGDIIWAKPVYTGLDEVFAPVIERQIPWAYVFGNHDDEFDVSRRELMEYAMKKPYCLAQKGDKNLKGVGNYILEVKDAENKHIKTVLYFFDSGTYSRIKGIKGYDWFDHSQIDWYRKKSSAYTSKNNGKPYPGLAFFHIPLAEYPLMKAEKRDPIIGHKDEDECNGKINTGMFAAMRESGDVMGTFVGHDHDNDYIGTYYDIALAYGRYSGGKTVYNNLGLNGCRIIELTQDKQEFTSYIRLLGGEKLFPVKYPDSFVAPKESK